MAILSQPRRPQQQTKAVSPALVGKNIASVLINSYFGLFRGIMMTIMPNPEERAIYRLPRVVVVGTENSGKSTLLENITKVATFPRAARVCTKCPVKLCLTPSSTDNHHHDVATVTFRSETWELSKADIQDKVAAIMAEIPDNHIVHDEITVTIHGPDLPDFELIDLPGIREYPVDMAAASKELTNKYLSDEDTLVLCVVPATSPSLTSNQAIASIYSQKKQSHTILALTMCDLVQDCSFMDQVVSSSRQ